MCISTSQIPGIYVWMPLLTPARMTITWLGTRLMALKASFSSSSWGISDVVIDVRGTGLGHIRRRNRRQRHPTPPTPLQANGTIYTYYMAGMGVRGKMLHMLDQWIRRDYGLCRSGEGILATEWSSQQKD